MESAQAQEQGPIEVPKPQAAKPSEFDDFLSDLGSEPNCPSEPSDSVLKDSTIAELTSRLQDLQALGDQLAATERERLAAVARIMELEAAAEKREAPAATPKARTEQLEKQVESLARARDRQTERLDRMRTKFEDRKRVAADRWRELLELKRELKALKRAA